MRGIYTYIPETNYVPREYGVAAILLLLFMVLISLVPVLNLLYFYISTFRSMCAVPTIIIIVIIIIICSSSGSSSSSSSSSSRSSSSSNCNLVVTRWQWLFYMYKNMKFVTTRFKSGGLHEKQVVATWNVGNHLSICF